MKERHCHVFPRLVLQRFNWSCPEEGSVEGKALLVHLMGLNLPQKLPVCRRQRLQQTSLRGQETIRRTN